MSTPFNFPTWIPWCKSEYTLDAIRSMKAQAEAEGYETRVDYKGEHVAGDGEVRAFGKLFVRTPAGDRRIAMRVNG